MVRIIKTPEVRKKEILMAARELFQTLGYNQTSVNAIIQKAAISKGTFYYYFHSKNEVLSYIAYEIVKEMTKQVKFTANIPEMNALEKMKMLLRGQSDSFDAGYEIVDHLHKPENRELHERINTEIVLEFGPIITKVVEQGNKEGHFNVEKPLETVQFLLAGSVFLFNPNAFAWSKKQIISRTIAMQTTVERALGAKKGSLSFLLVSYDSSSKKKKK